MDRKRMEPSCVEPRRISAGLCALASVLLFSFAAPAAESKPVATFACNEFPPHKMQAAPDGQPGYDVEILREAFRRAGREIKVMYFPWKRALETAKSGRVDGLCSCSRRPERDAYFIYSDVMGDVGVGVFKKPGLTRKLAVIADLKGLSVGVVRAYNLHDELVDLGMAPVAVGGDEQGLRILLLGRIDAFVTFRDTGKYLLRRIATETPIAYSEFHAAPYFACFSKASPDAEARAATFNAGLAAMRADGVYDAILARYR